MWFINCTCGLYPLICTLLVKKKCMKCYTKRIQNVYLKCFCHNLKICTVFFSTSCPRSLIAKYGKLKESEDNSNLLKRCQNNWSKMKSNAQEMDVLSSSRSSELNEQCLNGWSMFQNQINCCFFDSYIQMFVQAIWTMKHSNAYVIQTVCNVLMKYHKLH